MDDIRVLSHRFRIMGAKSGFRGRGDHPTTTASILGPDRDPALAMAQ